MSAIKQHYLYQLRLYFRKATNHLVLGSLCGILMNTLGVLPAILLGRAVDVILAYERGQAEPAQVSKAALVFLGGTLATQLARLGKRWWLMTANGHIRAEIRAGAIRGVLGWPMQRLHGHSIGELMARIVGDVEVLGVGIHDFTVETWDTVLFTVSVVVAMLAYNPTLAAMALIPTPLTFVILQLSRRWIQKRTTIAREANAALSTTLQEQLSGLRVIRLFGKTDEAASLVEQQSQCLGRANFSVQQLREGIQPLYATLMAAGALLVIAMGGRQVVAGALSVGAFVGFMDLFLRFSGRAYRIPRLFNTIQTGGVAYTRLRPLLDPVKDEVTRPLHQPEPAPPFIAPRQKELMQPLAISLNGVSFRYPGAEEMTLKDISLDISPGSFVAITGPVGCGKSALLRLILGLYPVEAGEIWLDGIDQSDERSKELTHRIGYLHQEPYLFSGNIAENIAFGPTRTVDPRRLNQAIHTALLDADIQALPSGLNTPVGESGRQVSGGQRQRIAMARSLAATPVSPGLLLLDDPFSAVDLVTEAGLIASLRQTFGPGAPEGQRATILLSSHRLAAFPQADLIIVLNQGRIWERGTHEQLLAGHGLYARIFQSQNHPVARPEPEHLRFPGEVRMEGSH